MREQYGIDESDAVQDHAQPKSYQCPVCSKQFTRDFELQEQMCIHSQQKPYMCLHCSKRFRRIIGLNVQGREVHGPTTTTSWFVCTDFKIKDDQGYVKEERVGCGVSFSRFASLEKHQNTVAHNNKIQKGDLEKEIHELGCGVPLEAFTVWVKTGKTTDLAELNQSMIET